MEKLLYHGKEIFIDDALAAKYKKIRGRDVNIDDMDLSVTGMVVHLLPKEQIKEWKDKGDLRQECINYALSNCSTEQLTQSIVHGIEVDIKAGEFLCS